MGKTSDEFSSREGFSFTEILSTRGRGMGRASASLPILRRGPARARTGVAASC